jgi:hypothetical protein
MYLLIFSFVTHSEELSRIIMQGKKGKKGKKNLDNSEITRIQQNYASEHLLSESSGVIRLIRFAYGFPEEGSEMDKKENSKRKKHKRNQTQSGSKDTSNSKKRINPKRNQTPCGSNRSINSHT